MSDIVTPSRPRRVGLAFAGLVAVTVAVLGACSTDPPLDDAAVVTVDLVSQDTRLSTADGTGEVIYGWNHLAGTGVIESPGSQDRLAEFSSVAVDMLGQVNYLDGNGPFDGFITFTFGDGSTLAVAMLGRARAATDTSDASFSADLDVLGGTGRLAGVTGVGRFEGSRTAVLGSPVQARFHLSLDPLN
jgi:hypothetical protein